MNLFWVTDSGESVPGTDYTKYDGRPALTCVSGGSGGMLQGQEGAVPQPAAHQNAPQRPWNQTKHDLRQKEPW